MSDTQTQPYRVLARKYRPSSFAELIGQDAMVQTLGNAIARGRLAHAFLLTGVRGVGKTSTARLIAKALNCVGSDGQGGPTIEPCGVCEPCQAIAEGRHIDVVEMDAASHTGVDDVREIIEAVRYAAVSARYKVYIIDEVHMLTKNAFNALLKTLEEPPGHVKFLFATTEIQKVPVTVLSRCQRFDLKRIPAERLADHFAQIVAREDVQAEEEALALVARAAEGSVRDGLSILDQAIAHGHGVVTAVQVREMLGLSDRSAVRDLFGLVLEGDAPGMLAALRVQYDLGTEPAALFRALLELVHGITRTKVTAGQPSAASAEEREALANWAGGMGFAALHRLWQLLLKGLEEVQSAPIPMEAAEMALLRIMHAAGLPDPADLVRRLNEGPDTAPAPAAVPPSRGEAAPAMLHQLALVEAVPAAAPVSAPVAEPAPAVETQSGFPTNFAAFVAFVEEHGGFKLAHHLHDDVGVIRYDPPELVLKPESPHLADLPRNLIAHLKAETGVSWLISYGEGDAEPSLREQEKAAAAKERAKVLAHPMVKAALDVFPDAELVDYSRPAVGKA